jgi:hypothetical protein
MEGKPVLRPTCAITKPHPDIKGASIKKLAPLILLVEAGGGPDSIVPQYFMLSQRAEGAGSTLLTVVGDVDSIPPFRKHWNVR